MLPAIALATPLAAMPAAAFASVISDHDRIPSASSASQAHGGAQGFHPTMFRCGPASLSDYRVYVHKPINAVAGPRMPSTRQNQEGRFASVLKILSRCALLSAICTSKRAMMASKSRPANSRRSPLDGLGRSGCATRKAACSASSTSIPGKSYGMIDLLTVSIPQSHQKTRIFPPPLSPTRHPFSLTPPSCMERRCPINSTTSACS